MLGRRFPLLSFSLASVALLASMSSSTGCAGDPPPFQPGTTTTVGSGGAGGGAEGHQGEEMFRALQADFVAECASCHKKGGIADTPFLGDPDGNNPDPYDAVTSWPGIIVKDAANSVLLSWPASGVHSNGPISSALEAKLVEWLEEESKGVAAVEGAPVIPPFKPFVPGFYAVYLDPLGSEFAGMAITFQAEELTDKSLSLSTIQVHPTAKLGLELEHPLFTVYPAGLPDGDPDPVDSFSNVAQSVEPGTVAPLGPGAVILTNWVVGGKLSIAFETITIIDPMGGGGGGGGGGACSALPEFVANAAPALAPCDNCHGGQNGAATNAVDMTDLGSDDDAACGQIKNRINLTNPAQSQLFITTDPSGNATHPFKFGGNQANFNQFVQNVTQWINAEGM